MESRPTARTEPGDSLSVLKRLKSRQLPLLIALAEAKSLRKAAAELGMTQPAATKLLQDLERTIGFALFERGPRGMQPNTYGEAVIRHARLVVTDLNRTRLELASLSSGATGRIRIGAVISAIMVIIEEVSTTLRGSPAPISANSGSSTFRIGLPTGSKVQGEPLRSRKPSRGRLASG